MTLMEWLNSLLASPYTQPVVIAVITTLIGRIVLSRGKLSWGVSHMHFYQMPRLDDGGSFPVRTQQIWFHNPGRNAIEDVEIVLNWRPQHFEIWDPRLYAVMSLPDGRFAITVPTLAGSESFTLSIIDTFNDIPRVVNVRFKGGLGRLIEMIPQRVYPRWTIFCLLALTLIGIVTTINLLLVGVSDILPSTPPDPPNG